MHEGWACYHIELLAFDLAGIGEAGIVGCAVGAFAVLVAERLFASGSRLPVSVTPAGQITPIGPPPYFVLIDRALRDEGTSYHYLAGSTFAEAPDAALLARVEEIIRRAGEIALHRGATWTTDAPYRETASAIERARQLGALAVARSVENTNHQRALQGWVAALLPPASSRLLTKSDGFQ